MDLALVWYNSASEDSENGMRHEKRGLKNSAKNKKGCLVWVIGFTDRQS